MVLPVLASLLVLPVRQVGNLLAIEYGKQYLKSTGQDGQKISQEECQFCHIQQAPPFIEKRIKEEGTGSKDGGLPS